MEVDWLKRIALGTPKAGEGHTAEQKKLCLAIVPWAPVPSGAEAMLERLKSMLRGALEKSGGLDIWSKISRRGQCCKMSSLRD